MDEEAKEEIKIALEILKATLIRNGVSIGANKETGTLYFFDTLTYVSNGKFDGFKMELDELVRWLNAINRRWWINKHSWME